MLHINIYITVSAHINTLMYIDTYGEREREILNTWFHYVHQGKLQKYSIKLEIISHSPGFLTSLSYPLLLSFLIHKILSFELSRVQCQFTLSVLSPLVISSMATFYILPLQRWLLYPRAKSLSYISHHDIELYL